jgi:hypothetical protein
MLTRDESPAPSTGAVSSTSRKLLQLLRKRLRQLARVTLVLAIGIALAATALAVWWWKSLDGLPDIGDPFDVAEYRAIRVPDNQNAFTFLGRADGALTPMPAGTRAAGVPGVVSWSQADPKLRDWVEANRRALELFQQGAEQADAANPAGDHEVNGTRSAWLALLEGSKRQEGGDSAGAWECYRAVLRMTTHMRRRGCLHQRFDVNVYWNGSLRQRLAAWAADPRTTIRQLRAALDEVLKGEPRAEWDAFGMKSGYLEMIRSLEQPIHPLTRQEIEGESTYRLDGMQLSPEMVGHLDAARRFLLREPERSRRVLRLLCANWLADLESPVPGRAGPTARARISAGKNGVTLPLYPVSPDAPTGARSLPPGDIAVWLVTTEDAKLRILVADRFGWPWPPDRRQDRRAHRALVVMMATEIYRRERGALPPSEEALVGSYLQSLPDDGSPGPAGAQTPTVE